MNLAGFFHLSQRAAAAMLPQRSGHIVTVTTSLVDQPMAAVPAALAALTKGGLDAVTRSLAIEYAASGIRVNAVSPGIIKTPMHRSKRTTSSRRFIPWAVWAQSRKLSKRCST